MNIKVFNNSARIEVDMGYHKISCFYLFKTTNFNSHFIHLQNYTHGFRSITGFYFGSKKLKFYSI